MLIILPLVLLISVGFTLVLLWWYQNYSHVSKCVNKIPGPPGYPIVGNFLDYLANNEKLFQNDRHRSSTYFPIYRIWLFHKTSVGLVHPKDIEILLTSAKHIKKSQIYDILHMWLGTGLLTSHGDKWKMRRKMLTPAFHFSILQNFVDIFNEATTNLAENLNKRFDEPWIDVVPPITEFTMQSMAETSMGTSLNLNNASHKSYKSAVYDFGKTCVYRVSRPWVYNNKVFRMSPLGPKAHRSVKTLHEFTESIIKDRKQTFQANSYTVQKRLAMLDLLLKAQQDGVNIDDEGIREEVDTFMFEGYDTTATAICYMLMLLANHRHVQDEIRQEIIDLIGDSHTLPTYGDLQQLPYTERCIKECLRLYPSVPMIGRDIEEDIQTSTGYTIPKGAMAHVFIFDLHRNPTLYPDPLKFDPDRFLPDNVQQRHPFAYIPFSAGPRNCIGQRFALLELKTVLCGLLRKFILEPVDGPEDIVFTADLVLRSRDPIRVRFLERNRK